MALLHSTQCIVAVSLFVCFNDIKQGSLFDISSLKKKLRMCRPSKMEFFLFAIWEFRKSQCK